MYRVVAIQDGDARARHPNGRDAGRALAVGGFGGSAQRVHVRRHRVKFVVAVVQVGHARHHQDGTLSRIVRNAENHRSTEQSVSS